MNTRAMQAFYKQVQGSNFMTPDVVDYGYLGNTTIAYEISKGHEIDNEAIYGFTVGLPVNDPRRREWSGMFYSLSEIQDHIAELEKLA